MYIRYLPYSIYDLKSAVLVLSYLHNHFFSPFMDLQCCKLQIGLKIEDFVFLTPILHQFGSFCTFFSLHILVMPCRVQFWYCFICTTIFLVHLWIYSVPIGKLALKLTILYFSPPFCPTFGPFATSRASTTYLRVPKCIFCIFSFVQPFSLSIYGFTLFQMAN